MNYDTQTANDYFGVMSAQRDIADVDVNGEPCNCGNCEWCFNKDEMTMAEKEWQIKYEGRISNLASGIGKTG